MQPGMVEHGEFDWIEREVLRVQRDGYIGDANIERRRGARQDLGLFVITGKRIDRVDAAVEAAPIRSAPIEARCKQLQPCAAIQRS